MSAALLARVPQRTPVRPHVRTSRLHAAKVREVAPALASQHEAVGPSCWRLLASRYKAMAACAVSAALSLLLSASPAAAETRYLHLTISENEETQHQQAVLLEAWRYVRELFYDSLQLTHWDADLERHMRALYYSDDREAWQELSEMLATLEDPYTRVVSPEQYAEFRVGSDGSVSGVGLVLASDPESKRLFVVAPMKNSPAERAGVKSGDVVTQINGVTTEGLDREHAARLLRGKRGTNVRIQARRPLDVEAIGRGCTVSRASDQLPGVAARPLPEAPRPTIVKNVNMLRDVVRFSPVFATKLEDQGRQLGYIRLTSFSNNAPREVKRAVLDLAQAGATGFILDLRDNPGGLVDSGMDVARLWLNGAVTVFNVAGRDSSIVQRMQLDDGRAVSDDPLVVLVNSNSASAAEILAGALHDHGRAMIVGSGPTYGKGKIQNLYELLDGSALFVTVAKYKTPHLADIDHVGITPDVTCGVPVIAELEREESFQIEGAATVQQQLADDPCFIAAERVLTQQMQSTAAQRRLPYTGHLKLMSASTIVRHR